MSLTELTEAELARTGLRLAFAPELEARYLLDIGAERSRELRNISQIAMLLYFGLGLLMKVGGVIHESWQDCLLQLVGLPAALLLLAHYCFRPKTSNSVREASALACCLIACLAAILVAYVKPATTQDLIVAALPANFVLMFMRLRFPLAVVFALVMFGSYATAVVFWTGIAPPQRAFLITFIAILCLPALIGVHSLERASRSLYLYVLLQRLRLERLAVENNTLTVLSLTDPLTQIANRRRLDMALRTFCADAAEGGVMLLIDVDRFKAINDNYGHQAGDSCLQQLVERLSGCLRRCDLLARFGGEEFAVLLPGVSGPEAAFMAERLRAAIQARPFAVEGAQMSVTISIGIATRNADTVPETLIEAADLALYTAKNAGRNQVRA